MQSRMKNPAFVLEETMPILQSLAAVIQKSGVPETTLELVALRASQINGCSVCVDGHPRILKKKGVSDERIHAVAAWRDMPYFDEAERAALALTESVTRLADREDPVPDSVWNAAKKHYDERQLAALVFAIANINVWNRLNVATRQVAGAWKP